MSSPSANLALNLLTNGEDPNTWDVQINANWVIIDDLFHQTTGHTHDGTAGNGGEISHADLESVSIGSTSHADIDTHIGNAALHFAASTVEIEVENDSVSVATGIDVLNFVNAQSVTDSSGTITIDVGSTPIGGTGPSTGTPTHLRSTHAPVATTDHFLLGTGRPLSDGNWITQTGAGKLELVYDNDKAVLSIDRLRGDIATGAALNRVKTAIPHSEVQRVTIEVPSIDLSTFTNAGPDAFTFQLALMSSAISSVNAVSRLGFFLKIDLFRNSGGSIVMTRSLNVQSMVDDINDLSVVNTIWQDTGAVDVASRHYQGIHEFSLDRDHAFHYYFNHGPVDLGTAGDALAATPHIATLQQSLLAEHTLFPQTPPATIYVSPEFGHFGFDVEWNVPESGTVSFIGKHFDACGLDDEDQAYTRVNAIDAPTTLVPVKHPGDCCTGGSYDLTEVGDIIPVPALSDSQSVNDIEYQVTCSVPANDPVYLSAGFRVRPLSQIGDDKVEDDVVYCSDMANPVLHRLTESRPCEWGRIKISGDNLTSLVDTPVFKPSDPTVALPTSRPAGVGTFSQATPFPIPAQPGVGDSPSYWLNSLAVDESVFAEVNVSWADGCLFIDYKMADGLPMGASYDLTFTDRLDVSNTFTITNAVILSAPNTDFRDVRLYIENPAGGVDNRFTRVEALTACQTVYVVAYTKGLPLELTPSTNGTEAQTLWDGYPFSVTDVPGAFGVFEENTPGVSPSGVTIDSSSVEKGWYRGDPVAEFPPTEFTPETLEGETLFLTITFDAGTYNNGYLFSASHPNEASASTDTFLFPRLTSPDPIIDSFVVSPDTTSGTGKTVTVTGTCFNDVLLTAGTGITTLVLSSQSATQVVFTCDTTTVTTVDVTITNETGSGGSASVSWLVDSANAPTITNITPDPVVEATKNQTFTVTGTNFDTGAFFTSTPSVTFLDYAFTSDVAATFTIDVPDTGGSTLDVAVNNPNGNVSATDDITISVASVGAITLVFPSTGKEPGKTNESLEITGSGFRDGVIVSTNKAQYLRLGDITALSGSSIDIDYSLDPTTPTQEVIQVTVTDLASGVSASTTFTVEDNTPEITFVTLANPREGAGDPAAPANSAKVSINGKYFNASNLDTVTVTTGNGTVVGVTKVDDNLVTIDELNIDSNEATNTFTLRLTTINDAKTTDYSFTVEGHLVPKISGFTLLNGSSEVLDPKVIPLGASGYSVELFGHNLGVDSLTVNGPFVAGPLGSTITQGQITVDFAAVLNPILTAEPAIEIVLTPIGTSTTYTTTVAVVDATLTVGAVTVLSTVAYQFIEGSKASTLEINGTFLHANRVGSVELVADVPGLLPVNLVNDTSARSAITMSATDFATDGTMMTATADIADLLALADEFDLVLKDEAGATILTVDKEVIVTPNLNRVGYDYSALPAVVDTASAAMDYTFTLLRAEGGETLEVFGGTSVVNVSTGLPTTVNVTFTNPGAGNEVEVRLINTLGVISSIFRYITV